MTFDHMVVMASDLEASLPWYAVVLAALGFEKTRDHVWVNAEGQAFDLKQAEEVETPYRRRGVGLNHIAFQARSFEALQGVLAAMAAAGLETPEVQDFGDERAVFLKDRDGMRIEVVVYGQARQAT